MTHLFDETTRGMIAALDEEIAAIKERGGTQRVGLRNGHLAGAAAGRHLYMFALESDLNVPADTPGLLAVGERSYEATVVGIREFDVTVALREYAGDRIPMAILSLTPYYLLEVLRTRLAEVHSGKIAANREMALRVLAKSTVAVRVAAVAAPAASEDGHPNGEQMAAVDRSTSRPVSFIWGPPGTGKTETIGLLIGRLLELGRTVLVVSHTNVAVDTAVAAIAKALEKSEHPDGTLIRFGQPQRAGTEQFALEAVVARRSQHLLRERQDLRLQRDGAEGNRARLVAIQAKVLVVQSRERAWRGSREAVAPANACIGTLEGAVAQAERSLAVLQHRLLEAETAGFLKRLFLGLNPEAIKRDISRQDAQRAALRDQLREAQTRLAEAVALEAAAAEALRAARLELESFENVPADLPARIAQLERECEALNARLGELERQLQAVEANVLAEANVIAATLSRLALAEQLYSRRYDAVIVDEASMAPLPSLWLASCLATTHVVVVGDFRQLAPIATSDGPLAADWLRRDVFRAVGVLNDQGAVQLADPRLSALCRQYRMHEVIGRFVSDLAYSENRLLHRACKGRLTPGLSSLPEPGHALVLCDTSEANPWCARLQPGWSRYNIYSAIVCVRIAAAARTLPGLSVGIVTPYRAQARLIRGIAAEHGLLDDGRLEIATVHRFQGNEKDVMVFDLADGPPFPLGKLLKGDRDSDSLRLVNVACSRVIGKLVVVAHHAYLSSNCAKGSPLRALLDYAMREGRYCRARQFVEHHGDADVEQALSAVSHRPASMVETGDVLLFDEDTFYQAFCSDLAAARERVLIYSPFVEAHRTAELMPILRMLRDRGVAVTVITRQVRRRDDGIAELVTAVRDAGIRIAERPDLHEKLAFVDERIAWFGSLNVLSQSRSTERMMRFSQPGFVKQLMELTGTLGLLHAEDVRSEGEARFTELVKHILRRMSAPRCPACGRPTKPMRGPFGPFFGCTRFERDHPKSAIAVPRAILVAAVEDLGLRCPGCEGGNVVLRVGKRGPFLSCNRYPECKWTASI